MGKGNVGTWAWSEENWALGDDGDGRSQGTEMSKPRKAWDGGPACAGVGLRQEVGYLTAQPPGLLDPC